MVICDIIMAYFLCHSSKDNDDNDSNMIKCSQST